jgi:hypothetical protein
MSWPPMMEARHERANWNLFQKGPGQVAALPRPDRRDVCRRRKGTSNHRPWHWIQAVRTPPDPVDGQERNAARLPPAQEAREEGIIPWDWIVDETRSLERVPAWDDPAEYARTVARSYRRDFWNQQPHRVQVWSEKGTVRGLLAPVLDKYAVGFNPVHGFDSATDMHNVCEDDDGRPLIVLYVGDYDPSGMCMSEKDLPTRFAKYNGDHIVLRRIALTAGQLEGLPSFPASDKRKDSRYKWFVRNYGLRCWELDAMDPNELRDCVEREIIKLIEPEAWRRCEVVNAAEQQSLRTVLGKWGAA